MQEVSSQSLQQSVLHLDNAYTDFFRSNKGFPKFKSKKHSKKCYTIPDIKYAIHLFYNENKIKIPKFSNFKQKDNRIKCIFDRQITDGKIKSATVSQTKEGKYYFSILVEIDKEHPNKPELNKESARGLDFGVHTFITTSENKQIQNPRYFEQSREKLKKHQQELVKLDKDTTKYKSKQKQITKLHAKISRQRNDFLHKLTYKLTHENQVNTICIEDLSMQNMVKDKNNFFNRKVNDLSWYEFTRQLQYKSDWYGKNFIKIGRFEPSSKTCSNCGSVKHDLTLSDRKWTCRNCNIDHDRDHNAAKNILDFAFTKMNFKKGRDYPIEVSK